MAHAVPTAPAQSSAPFTMRAILVPLVAIIVGIFMVVLDGTAVNVALPSLVRAFNDTLPTLQWTITGYSLAQAAVIPLAGWISDRYGAKQLFLISVALFTIGSVLCAAAQSSGMLIAFRVLQGMGGGFVLPVAMAYIYRLSPPERVGAVMGLMGIPILFAPALGPVLAGWLVQFADWRWIFLLNLPVGIFGVLIGMRGLPAIGRQAVAPLDLPGLVLAPLAFASLCYGLAEGSTSWTSTNTLVGIAVGLAALVAFIVVELRVANPLLELRVFRSLDFSLAVVVQWIGQFALFGALFLLPLFLQQVRGYGAFDTGLTMLPQALGAAIFMPLGGVLFDRIGARPLVVVGCGLIAIATFILAGVSITTRGWDLVGPLFMYGAGMGLMLMPLNTQAINAAPRRLVSRVTSLTNALQQVVNSLTVAGLATILTSRPSYHSGADMLATAAKQAALAAHKAGKVVPHAAGSPSLPAPIASLFATAFDDTFKLMAILAVFAAAMGFVLRRQLASQAEDSAAEAHSVAPTPQRAAS